MSSLNVPLHVTQAGEIEINPDTTPDERQACMMVIQQVMTPAPDQVLEAWLAELDAVTAKRDGSEFSTAMRLRSYVNRLRDYPADVVKNAMLGRRWKFWPTWAELADVLDGLVAHRRKIQAAVMRPAPRVAPREPRATAQQVSAITAAAGYLTTDRKAKGDSDDDATTG